MTVDLHVPGLDDGGRGRSDSIYRRLHVLIADGRLRPGDRLPATRALAAQLQVSRNTVAGVYDRLCGEGLTEAFVGRGTFVSADVRRSGPGSTQPAGELRPRPGWEPFLRVPPQGPEDRPARYDFRPGHPDPGLFPHAVWRRLVDENLRPRAVGTGSYGDPAGLPRLREALAQWIGVSRGVSVAPEDVVVTAGTQQAVDLILRVLLAPGARVAVEEPGYSPVAGLVATSGLDLVQVPVDSDGLVVDALPDDVRLVYTTPSHQFPLGVAMSLRRRVQLLDWADRVGAAIIEDDYDSEFRHTGRGLDPLHMLDRSGRVLYVGSLSKTLLPSLRLGFIAATPGLRDALTAARKLSDWHSPVAYQGALADLIRDGHLARHLTTCRAVYRRRHARLLHALEEELGGVLEALPSAAGLQLAARYLPGDRATLRAVLTSARRDHDVAIHPIDRFSGLGLGLGRGPADPDCLPGVVLGFGRIDEHAIPEGLARLARAVRHSRT